MTNENTDDESEDSVQITREEMDSFDEDYVLAGRLLGTKWSFENDVVQEVVKVRKGHTTEQGMKKKYPELVFDQGTKLAVKSFASKVRDTPELRPCDSVARDIARHEGW